MTIPQHRDLSYGAPVPETWPDALEKLLASYQALEVRAVNATTIGVSVVRPAAAAAIAGKWRFIEAAITRAHPGGAAGPYDIYLVASANSFVAGAGAETDNTNYAFELRIVAEGAAAPTGTLASGEAITHTQLIRKLDWSGTAITRIRYLDPADGLRVEPRHAAQNGLEVLAPAGYTGDLIRCDGSVGALLRVKSDGTLSARQGFQVNDVPLAASHLSNGVVGSGAVVLATGPTLSGTPLAPTAAIDTNTTQIATTAFVVGQAASAAPLGPGIAAAGSSLRYARADHVHPIDTSRAPTASPTFTGTVTMPSLVSSAAALGFFGVTPAARPAVRTQANWTIGANARRTLDRNSFTIQNLYDYVATIVSDLTGLGLLQ